MLKFKLIIDIVNIVMMISYGYNKVNYVIEVNLEKGEEWFGEGYILLKMLIIEGAIIFPIIITLGMIYWNVREGKRNREIETIFQTISVGIAGINVKIVNWYCNGMEEGLELVKGIKIIKKWSNSEKLEIFVGQMTGRIRTILENREKYRELKFGEPIPWYNLPKKLYRIIEMRCEMPTSLEKATKRIGEDYKKMISDSGLIDKITEMREFSEIRKLADTLFIELIQGNFFVQGNIIMEPYQYILIATGGGIIIVWSGIFTFVLGHVLWLSHQKAKYRGKQY